MNISSIVIHDFEIVMHNAGPETRACELLLIRGNVVVFVFCFACL